MITFTVNQIILKVWRIFHITLLTGSFADSFKHSSFSPIQISLSLNLYNKYYFYLSITLDCTWFYWPMYILYLPTLSVFPFVCILFTSFLRLFYCMPVYSFTSLVWVFFRLLVHITIMYISFDTITLLSSHFLLIPDPEGVVDSDFIYHLVVLLNQCHG